MKITKKKLEILIKEEVEEVMRTVSANRFDRESIIEQVPTRSFGRPMSPTPRSQGLYRDIRRSTSWAISEKIDALAYRLKRAKTQEEVDKIDLEAAKVITRSLKEACAIMKLPNWSDGIGNLEKVEKALGPYPRYVCSALEFYQNQKDSAMQLIRNPLQNKR